MERIWGGLSTGNRLIRVGPVSNLSGKGFLNPHAAGFRLSNFQLGNPGPQGPIDYNTSQYKPVVPYTYIIE